MGVPVTAKPVSLGRVAFTDRALFVEGFFIACASSHITTFHGTWLNSELSLTVVS